MVLGLLGDLERPGEHPPDGVVLAAPPGLQGCAQGERDTVHSLLHSVVQLVEDAALLQLAGRLLLLAVQAPAGEGDQRDAQSQVKKEYRARRGDVGWQRGTRRRPEEHDAEVDGGREGTEPEGEDPPRRYPALRWGGRGSGAERSQAKEYETQSPEQVGPADEPVSIPGSHREVPSVGEREHHETRREERGEGGSPGRR